MAIGDLDGDGAADLAVTNHADLLNSPDTVSVLLNLGAGNFAPRVDHPTGFYPSAVAIADLDSDGRSDLAVVCMKGVAVLLNQGGAQFAPAGYPGDEQGTAIAIADLDGDGRPDLAVPSAASGMVNLFFNLGGGTFASAIDYPFALGPNLNATAVAAGDLDGDGAIDLAVAGRADFSYTVGVLRNRCW